MCQRRFCHTETMRYTERVPLRLEKNTASHMDTALRDGETRADFIRAAIGHEIGWRQSTVPLQPFDAKMHDAMTRITDFIAAEREAGRDVPLTDDGIRRLLAVAYPGIEI